MIATAAGIVDSLCVGNKAAHAVRRYSNDKLTLLLYSAQLD